jgi:hypothetical protein
LKEEDQGAAWWAYILFLWEKTPEQNNKHYKANRDAKGYVP